MYKKYSTFLFLASLTTLPLLAQSVVDCRVITGGTTMECNPYSVRLIRAKEVVYDKNKQKLIVTKTLPLPGKKPKMKIITVADMIEKYVKVEDSMRYRSSYDMAFEKTIEGSPRLTKQQREEQKRKEVVERIEALKQYLEYKRLEKVRLAEQKQKEAEEERQKHQGYYTISRGDTLSTIAAKYGIKTKDLVALNQIEESGNIRIGKKLLIPFSQEIVDAISTGSYTIKNGDTLISVARKFNLKAKEIVKFNHLESTALICTGKTIQLPLPYRLKAMEAKRKAELAEKKLAKSFKRQKSTRLIRGFGKHKLRVTATAYTSHGAQTDATPFLAAWNNHIRPGMKIIAVSRDLLSKYGLRNGSRVRIGGLPGIYRVRDKMNKRYRKRIDIYMGLNRRRALQWGRRSVILYW